MPRKQTGFTIVELLIVIVVIGILAAITVVAYNGVQTKALNSSRIAELHSWERIIRAYQVEYGPLTDVVAPVAGGSWRCLGDGYPDVDGDGVADCHYIGPLIDPTMPKHPDAALNTALKKTATALPNNTRKPVSDRLGPLISITSTGVYIYTYQQSTGTCPDGLDNPWRSDPENIIMCRLQVSP